MYLKICYSRFQVTSSPSKIINICIFAASFSSTHCEMFYVYLKNKLKLFLNLMELREIFKNEKKNRKTIARTNSIVFCCSSRWLCAMGVCQGPRCWCGTFTESDRGCSWRSSFVIQLRKISYNVENLHRYPYYMDDTLQFSRLL